MSAAWTLRCCSHGAYKPFLSVWLCHCVSCPNVHSPWGVSEFPPVQGQAVFLDGVPGCAYHSHDSAHLCTFSPGLVGPGPWACQAGLSTELILGPLHHVNCFHEIKILFCYQTYHYSSRKKTVFIKVRNSTPSPLSCLSTPPQHGGAECHWWQQLVWLGVTERGLTLTPLCSLSNSVF